MAIHTLLQGSASSRVNLSIAGPPVRLLSGGDMQTIVQRNPFAGTVPAIRANSRHALWTGRLLSGLAVAFLIFDSVGKLLVLPPVIDGTKELGYAPDIVFSLGVTLLSCVVVYVIPRTSVLGAVLLTGYLGG